MSGNKNDTNKPKMSLLPSYALAEVAQVMTMGAEKYGRYNYLDGMEYSRILDANLRHLNAFIGGEDNDAESGLSHLAHAAANSLMLLEYIIRDIGEDDRYPGEMVDLDLELLLSNIRREIEQDEVEMELSTSLEGYGRRVGDTPGTITSEINNPHREALKEHRKTKRVQEPIYGQTKEADDAEWYRNYGDL